MKRFFYFLITTVLLLTSCSDEYKRNKPFFMKGGKWLIEKEVHVIYKNNELEDMKTYVSTGEFEFDKKNNGVFVQSGTSQVERPFTWNVDEKQKLHIFYAGDTYETVYDIKKQEKEDVTLFLMEKEMVSIGVYNIKEITYSLKKSK